MKPVDIKYVKDTIELANTMKESAIVMGGRLLHIKDNGLWEGMYSKWEEFVEAIDMSAGTASKLMTIHTEWVVNNNFTVKELSDVGISKLYAGRKLLGTKSKDDVLLTVKELERDDIEKLVKGDVGEHEHNLVTFCTICRERVYDPEKED